MDQLPHAPVGIAEFVGGFVLWQALDEDGAQRLVLAVVGCGIGLHEELPATVIVHGCVLKCEVVFGGVLPSKVESRQQSQAKTDGPQGFGREETRAPAGRTRQNHHAPAAENRITSTWAGEQKHSVFHWEL
ncbi:MAG TPA: hypothetical protein VFS35_00555 [Terrimicrobiaceae bacterium]|nr:hypothetical protein [Terrimicrobiaceae bacterium]